MGWALYYMLGLNRNKDVLYTMLPMYHSSANGLVTGCVISEGTKNPNELVLETSIPFFPGLTMVCRKKFSASNYWKDCVEHKVTVRF